MQRVVIGAGDYLNEGDGLQSLNGGYFFNLQSDGGLVLYVSQHTGSKNVLWSSGTVGQGTTGSRRL